MVMTDQAAPIPETPEPFKGPFRVDVLDKIDKWCVRDTLDTYVMGFKIHTHAQWLCDRLNATPTVNARAAAEEIITQIHGKLFSKHLGSQAKAEVAAIIAKHFATPAQSAPAEGGLLSAAEWHEAEAARLQSIPFTEITLSQANRWQLHLEAANAFRRRSALAAQGERAGLTAEERDSLLKALEFLRINGNVDYADALSGLLSRLTGAKP